MATKHKPRAEQENLPGTDEKNDRAVRPAKMYAKRRDERIAANVVEKEQHEKLLETMIEEGLDSYSYGDVDVTINNSRKARGVIGGEKPSENGDGEEEAE